MKFLSVTNEKPLPFPKTALKSVWNFAGLPLRTIALPEPEAERWGFTSLQQERINAVWPYLSGKLLDVGAGNNRLVNLYQNGTGIEVYDWKGGAIVVNDTAHLPFGDGEFDTVTLMACLNHIPTREQTIREVCRVLRPGGRCLLTMINPLWGYVAHTLLWHEESHERGMEDGELGGLWRRQTLELIRQGGLSFLGSQRFFYSINELFFTIKPEGAAARK